MKKKAKGKSIYKKQDNIAGYVMLAPWMFGFLLMWFIPMLISIYYSFTNFNLLNDAKVIGFDNYIRIFTQDETFRQALKVTFIYVLFLVPLRLAFALLVAVSAYIVQFIIFLRLSVEVSQYQLYGDRFLETRVL